MVPNERFKINAAKIVYDSIDGEVIMINFDTGNYYSLNSTGKDIWSCIERNSSLSELINEISAKYNAEEKTILEDMTKLLADLKQEELILSDIDDNKSSLGAEAEMHFPNNGKEILKYEKPGFQKYTDMKEMLLLDPIHEVDETGWPATKISSKKKDQNK
jgi:Coenzyme PQQ synthesis protein D (PqqD)